MSLSGLIFYFAEKITSDLFENVIILMIDEYSDSDTDLLVIRAVLKNMFFLKPSLWADINEITAFGLLSMKKSSYSTCP